MHMNVISELNMHNLWFLLAIKNLNHYWIQGMSKWLHKIYEIYPSIHALTSLTVQLLLKQKNVCEIMAHINLLKPSDTYMRR